MANKELITCDYKGCLKPFAYRNCGFNLCAEHCFVDTDAWWTAGVEFLDAAGQRVAAWPQWKRDCFTFKRN